MKKLIITSAFSIATCLSGFSQGQVFYQNFPTSGLYWNSTASAANKVTTGTIASQIAVSQDDSTGVVDVGLYWSTAVFTDPAQGILADTVTMNTTAAGDIAGPGNFAIPGAPSGEGSSIYVQVFAWDSNFATPDAALEAGAAFGAWSAGPNNEIYGLIGAPEDVLNLTPSPAPGIPIFGTGAGQFGRAVMLTTPEPATLALGGLGLSLLLVFRRRK